MSEYPIPKDLETAYYNAQPFEPLANYQRRTMWGTDGDDDVREALAVVLAGLKLAKGEQ